MPNKAYKLFCILTTVFCILSIEAGAELLDSPSPIFTQNHPLGRNPARAAFLRSKSKLNLSKTTETYIKCSKPFLETTLENNPNFEKLHIANEFPYTNSYFSGAMPLFSDSFYMGLVYGSNLDDIERKFSPTKELKDELIDYSHINQNITNGGLAFSFPLNQGLYLGLEYLQGLDLYSSYSENYEAGISPHSYSTTKASSWPYNQYTMGVLMPFAGDTNILSLTYTNTSVKKFYYDTKYVDFGNPNNNIEDDTEYVYLPPSSFGLGYMLNFGKAFQIGLSSEFFGNGIWYDSARYSDITRTKAFTRYSLAIETTPLSFLTLRLYGSGIKDKDARTNYYDWELHDEKILNYPSEDPNYDARNTFDEENIGLDLEFNFGETFSILLGTNQKKYIFTGRSSPYGFDAVVTDTRGFFGFSITGLFHENEKEPGPEMDDEELAELHGEEELVTEDEEIEEELPTTQPVRSNIDEALDISSTDVLPGTDINLTINEGQKKVFKASVVFTIKNRNYKYPLYQADEKTWKTTIPISPLTEPGEYRMKLYKVYNDAGMEMTPFEVTVKDINPKI